MVIDQSRIDSIFPPPFRLYLQPLEEVSAVTRNLVFSLRNELDREYIKVHEHQNEIRSAEGRSSHNFRCCRREFLEALGRLIMQHRDTYANTGEIQFKYTSHSDPNANTQNIQPFLSFPFSDVFQFSYLEVTEHIIPCDSMPTYIDDLTAITNVTHLMCYVCHEQTKILKDITTAHGGRVEAWQWRENYWFQYIAEELTKELRSLKEVLAAAPRGANVKRLILGTYDHFAGRVNSCASILHICDEADEAEYTEWERTYHISVDLKELNLLVAKLTYPPQPTNYSLRRALQWQQFR